jgi:hypothetical protein
VQRFVDLKLLAILRLLANELHEFSRRHVLNLGKLARRAALTPLN